MTLSRLLDTTCHTTVHTGPYTAVREVAPLLLNQRRKTERFEVSLGKPHMEGLGERQVPGSAAAAGHVGRQSRSHPQYQQCSPATANGFPLPPQSTTQSAPHPTGRGNQCLRRFAESEIAAPAPHIRSQFLHRRLHADAFGPSRNLPDSLLEPIHGLRRYDTLDRSEEHTSEL